MTTFRGWSDKDFNDYIDTKKGLQEQVKAQKLGTQEAFIQQEKANKFLAQELKKQTDDINKTAQSISRDKTEQAEAQKKFTIIVKAIHTIDDDAERTATIQELAEKLEPKAGAARDKLIDFLTKIGNAKKLSREQKLQIAEGFEDGGLLSRLTDKTINDITDALDVVADRTHKGFQALENKETPLQSEALISKIQTKLNEDDPTIRDIITDFVVTNPKEAERLAVSRKDERDTLWTMVSNKDTPLSHMIKLVDHFNLAYEDQGQATKETIVVGPAGKFTIFEKPAEFVVNTQRLRIGNKYYDLNPTLFHMLFQKDLNAVKLIGFVPREEDFVTIYDMMEKAKYKPVAAPSKKLKQIRKGLNLNPQTGDLLPEKPQDVQQPAAQQGQLAEGHGLFNHSTRGVDATKSSLTKPQPKWNAYKLNLKNGKYGNANVDVNKLFNEMKLVAKDQTGKPLKANIDLDFLDLVTKRFNKNRAYSGSSIALFQKLNKLAKIPLARGSGKAQIAHKASKIGGCNSCKTGGCATCGRSSGEMINRLSLITGAIQAGNTPNKALITEGIELLDMLLNMKAITKTQHQMIYQNFFSH